jgi:hypothetical protein
MGQWLLPLEVETCGHVAEQSWPSQPDRLRWLVLLIFLLVNETDGHDAGSIGSRIRALFYLSLTNFVIPGMQASADARSD